jgi:phosphoglycolate phosphatase-like HAD superfamily hydrolase
MGIIERKVFPALLVAVLAGTCVVTLAVITSRQHQDVVMESDKAERAVERGYFDSLEAKDKAKGVVASSGTMGSHAITAEEERKEDNEFFVKLARQQHALKGKMLDEKKGKPVKGKPVESKVHVTAVDKRKAVKAKHAVKNEHRHSMHNAFAQAKAQLAKEKREMSRLEEHDKVKEAEQKFEIERMTAHHQANEYERHLQKLNDKVFPTSIASLAGSEDTTSFVKNALVDNMNSEFVKEKEAAHKPVPKPVAAKAHT